MESVCEGSTVDLEIKIIILKSITWNITKEPFSAWFIPKALSTNLSVKFPFWLPFNFASRKHDETARKFAKNVSTFIPISVRSLRHFYFQNVMLIWPPDSVNATRLIAASQIFEATISVTLNYHFLRLNIFCAFDIRGWRRRTSRVNKIRNQIKHDALLTLLKNFIKCTPGHMSESVLVWQWKVVLIFKHLVFLRFLLLTWPNPLRDFFAPKNKIRNK